MDINSGRLFPWYFLVVAVALGMAAIGLLTGNLIAAFFLALISALILTASSGIYVDKHSGKYKEYNSFLFFKIGSWEKFTAIEVIFINSSKVSQKIYTAHTMQSATFVDREYNGYLKFVDGAKVHIYSSKNKKTLNTKLDKLALYLNKEIVDYT